MQSSSETKRIKILRYVGGLLFVCLFFCVARLQPIHAVDADCTDNLIEGLATSCMSYLDANGKPIVGAEFYKCADTIECDLDANGKNTRRCCVQPTDGSYGGSCFDPGDIDRKNLGTNSGGPNSFVNLKPKNCDVDEDKLSEAGKWVYVVPPTTPSPPPAGATPVPDPDPANGDEQSLAEYITLNDRTPPDGNDSVAGLPIIEETIQVEIRPLFQKPRLISSTWFYTVDDDGTRRYFIRYGSNGESLRYRIDGIPMGSPIAPIRPRDVRGGGKLDVLGNLQCKIGNAFLTPLYNGIGSLNRLVTNQNNLPDVALLCANGTPSFTDASVIQFDPDTGAMTGLDQTDCHCVDSNSGPGTAAVLLCTRFIAGIEDGSTGGAQWRALLPSPNASGVGSQRFMGLLFGAIEDTDSLEEFRQGVKTEIRDFFDSDEVRDWSTQLIQMSGNVYIPEVFLQRFFGVSSFPSGSPPLTPGELNTFKNNQFVKQYVGCLACAKYGGFPSALGCMPMDKADRFLTEGVLGIGITFAAAFSVLCIIFGAIQFQLSGGESAKVQKAQKLITQCILGLLVIIFSIFLLRFVGVNLLRIYGLG